MQPVHSSYQEAQRKTEWDEIEKECLRLCLPEGKKTWSTEIAEMLSQQAREQEGTFLFESHGNIDTFVYGNQKVVVEKRLVGGTAGERNGHIAVFIKKGDYDAYPWLRDILKRRPCEYYLF